MKKPILMILQKADNFKDLEMLIFRFICGLVRRVFVLVLKEIDKELMKNRNKSRLKHEDLNERTIETMFGSITIKRRYYYDNKEDEYKYLLDEYLGLPSNDRVSPGFKELTLEFIQDESYRKSADKANKKSEASASHTSIWKWVQEFGSKLRAETKRKKEELFEWGVKPEGNGEKIKTDYIFSEADGTSIYLQNEDKSKGEIKLGMLYTGWEKLHPMSNNYSLVGKRMFGGVFDSTELWKEIEVGMYEKFESGADLEVVLNGDGASWIDSGKDYLPEDTYRQLDEFHINRRIFWALGSSNYIPKINTAIENREKEKLIEILNKAKSYRQKEKQKENVEELKKYFLNHWEALEDYREKDIDFPDNARGMGAMESNIDKVIADRFKKKGMRWSKKGAKNLVKIKLSKINGELKNKLYEDYNWHFKEEKLEGKYKKVNKKLEKKEDPVKKGGLPALEGPDAGKDWVKGLKKIADPILNNPIDR